MSSIHSFIYWHRKAVLLESVPTEISIPSHPIPVRLIAFEHLSLSMVIWKSPWHTKADQYRPKQTKADQGGLRNTIQGGAGGTRGYRGIQCDAAKPATVKPDNGRPSQTMADQGRLRQTMHHAGGCRGCRGIQGDAAAAKPLTAKADYGRPSHCNALWYPHFSRGQRKLLLNKNRYLVFLHLLKTKENVGCQCTDFPNFLRI